MLFQAKFAPAFAATLLAACSMQTRSALPVPAPNQALRSGAATEYLYVVDTTAGRIAAYALPLTAKSKIAKTIQIKQPVGNSVAGLAVDSAGHVLYVSAVNSANFPPPEQPLYRCSARCKLLGTIPGGSGITIAGKTLYATAGIPHTALPGGYDYSEILHYAYTSSGGLGKPKVFYKDFGMDAFPIYTSVAVNGDYLAASGPHIFNKILVCTKLGARSPGCGQQSVTVVSNTENGAVALTTDHVLYLGLQPFYGTGGTTTFAGICTQKAGAYTSCKDISRKNQADLLSTAAVDSMGNFYTTEHGEILELDGTRITFAYKLPYSAGPLAVGG